MCMMPTFYKPLPLLLTGLLLLSAAIGHAQSSETPWPRTFTGQPDFDLARDEVLKERERKKANGEDVGEDPPTWRTLLTQKSFDPLRLNTDATQQRQDNKPLFPQVGPGEEAAAPQRVQQLPELEKVETLDLDEFKTLLENALSEGLKNAPPRYEEINFGAELKRIKINSIVLSPEKYVILNNRKYREGESIIIRIKMPPAVDQILAQLDTLMPDKESMPEENYKRYSDVRKDVGTAFIADRQKNPTKFVRLQPLNVTIQEIGKQKITFNVLGELHVVRLNFRF